MQSVIAGWQSIGTEQNITNCTLGRRTATNQIIQLLVCVFLQMTSACNLKSPKEHLNIVREVRRWWTASLGEQMDASEAGGVLSVTGSS